MKGNHCEHVDEIAPEQDIQMNILLQFNFACS